MQNRFTGLDAHKDFVVGTTLDGVGNIVREWHFSTTPRALRSFARELGPQDAVCLESTTNAVAIYRLLSRHAGRVVLSNPLQTKAIACAKIKTDKVDSLALAQLLRTGYLPTVWVPEEETLRLRSVSSYRLALVRQRTQVKNRIHSLLHRNLVPLPQVSDLFGKKGREFLQSVELPDDDRCQLDHELALLEFLGLQIQDADQRLAKAAMSDSRTELLLTIPGVSQQVAVGVLGAIGPIDRFAAPKKLVSYLGLDPLGRRTAGHLVGSTRISKQGRSHARWLLVEAANVAVKVPGPIQSFYVRLRKKKGHNKAIVAAARKLACLVWKILTTGEPYAWAPPQQTQEKIRRMQLLAGEPKKRPGPKKGQRSQGGQAGREARRKADYNLAKLAQAQYEELIRQRTEGGAS